MQLSTLLQACFLSCNESELLSRNKTTINEKSEQRMYSIAYYVYSSLDSKSHLKIISKLQLCHLRLLQQWKHPSVSAILVASPNAENMWKILILILVICIPKKSRVKEFLLCTIAHFTTISHLLKRRFATMKLTIKISMYALSTEN